MLSYGCPDCRRKLRKASLIDSLVLVFIGSVLGYLFAAVVVSRIWLH